MPDPGEKLFHLRAGAGEPPFVFVHGFACSHVDWVPQIEHFSQRHTVLACDLRGHGASPGNPADCSIESYGADIAALLARLKLPPAVLVGHSMGCRVVLQVALEAAERVAGVVLVDGSRLGVGEPDTAERVMREQIRATGYGAFARRLFEDMFLPSTEASVKSGIVERALQLPPAIGTELFPRLVGWDARNMERALAGVKAPLLVIQSTSVNAQRVRVPLKPGETTPWLDLVRARAPQARIEIVAGSGHFPQLEAAEAVNRLIGSMGAAAARKPQG